MYDELNVLDEERLIALENIICQKEKVDKYYNKKLRKKYFEIGDLVCKVILPMATKLKVLGKWSPNWGWTICYRKGVFRKCLCDLISKYMNTKNIKNYKICSRIQN